jgi:transcriptional regulator with XRE-family HTH domain
MSAKQTFSEDLRRAIQRSGKTRYQISKEIGVSEAVLCRFFQGRGMSIKTIDKLCAALGLRLRTEGKPRKQKGE